MNLPHPSPAGWPLIAALSIAVTACGSSEGYLPGVDLLTVGPVLRAADPPELRPDPVSGWDSLGRGGWSQQPSNNLGEPLMVVTDASGILSIPAGLPRDRTLSIRGRANVEPGTQGSVEVQLNGIELGSFEVNGELKDRAILSPASAWKAGLNRLELRPAAGAEFLGVTRVSYGPQSPEAAASDPSAAESAAVGERLNPGDRLVYGLTAAAGARLVLAAASTEPGDIQVVARPVTAPTGSRDAAVALDVIVDAADAAGTARVDLPAELGALAELEITWLPDDVGTLTLDQLDLERLESVRATLPEPPPLVVFVSVDTLAARNMSVYGYERATTPELDARGDEWVVFDHCTSNSTWTIPSYLSQFSGLLPYSNRVDPAEGQLKQPPWEMFALAESRLTLAELMRTAGYRTVGIVDNVWLAKIRGIRQGFDRFDSSAAARGITDTDGGVRHVLSVARDELARWDGETPLFLFLQVLDVHGPYMTVPPWEGTFASDDEGPVAVVAPNKVNAVGTVQAHIVEPHLAEGESLPSTVPVNVYRDAYDEKVLEMDWELNGFFEELRGAGHLDRSLVVLSADHGESLLHRDFFFRHQTAHEPTVHVPLLFRLPQADHGGTRVSGSVQLLDLYPTLAELVGVDPSGLELPGTSLVGAMASGHSPGRPLVVQADFLGQRAIVVDGWKLVETNANRTDNIANALTRPELWARWAPANPELARELVGGDDISRAPRYDRERFQAFDRRHPGSVDRMRKFFKESGPLHELFNLAEDPDETVNLATEYPEVVAEMVALLDGSEVLCARDREQVAGESSPLALSAESRRQLAELGYLDAD